MTDQVLLNRQDGLLTITLNRPERRNAMTPAMTAALTEALAAAAEDDAVRAVLLTGAGGHFCVGGDVKAMNEGAGADRPLGQRLHTLRDRMSAAFYLHTMPKPTIAAIEGSAAGAGLSLAMACDLRICAEDAKLTTAFAKVALSGDFGGSYFLTHILGGAKARELYLLSPLLSGVEAAEIGLVTRALPAGAVMETARGLAADLAAGPTLTYGRMKQNLTLAATGGSLADCLDQEARNHTLSMLTADHREAAAAFVEKRKAAFAGA
ncbi:enoyl-CoA hydratase [Haematobacter massiliensis]|uniref:Enoyl-CoA hydratase n=1 Tax=Haematobacter massiliensis TaxID=195105 RepID=A0A086Y4P1_9RHOB|nr:enoyl-CoA hydratase [Haematobacter massiliensis]KFI29241.1 enoyl-CoA hydratase [Haematobacter massiliensis]OWJ71958.1 enoyl-CoA hydratase [Haematobacter massiliensis]OWJ82176.1 enoyl-CoA hydratase [Haematobacter massiliensis]QBJ25857.1 enoyl-CoA hydratase [Haematobacter massiliensis]